MNKAIKRGEPSNQSLLEMPELDLTKARILGRGLKKDRRLPLRAMREAVGATQEDIADKWGWIRARFHGLSNETT